MGPRCTPQGAQLPWGRSAPRYATDQGRGDIGGGVQVTLHGDWTRTFGRWEQVTDRTLVEGPTTSLRQITEGLVGLLRSTLQRDAGWSAQDLSGSYAPQIDLTLVDGPLDGSRVLLAESRALVLTNPNPMPRLHLWRKQ